MKFRDSSILLSAILLLALSACNSGVTKAETQSAVKDSVITTTTVKDSVEEVSDGCTGGLPNKPIVDPTKYPHRQFRFENRIGYNDFVTSKGDSITIEQSNCDYATYRFIIRSTRAVDNSADTATWINKAADIIEEIKPGIQVAVDLDSGLHYLRTFYAIKDKPIGEEIDFNDRPQDQWRNVVIVNSATRNKDTYTLTITFYEGPL